MLYGVFFYLCVGCVCGCFYMIYVKGENFNVWVDCNDMCIGDCFGVGVEVLLWKVVFVCFDYVVICYDVIVFIIMQVQVDQFCFIYW